MVKLCGYDLRMLLGLILAVCGPQSLLAQVWQQNELVPSYLTDGTTSPRTSDFSSSDQVVSSKSRQSGKQAPVEASPNSGGTANSTERSWVDDVQVGYDRGFVIASRANVEIDESASPFRLKINGWGQLRHTFLSSDGPNNDLNQFQLKRGRIIFSGAAFTDEFSYYVQIDGRSTSGDDLRLLDYYLTYDVGHHFFGLGRSQLRFTTGKYKMPFTMARYLSGREFEFADRSMASTFFDVNRSFAWGLSGDSNLFSRPLTWDMAIFNGLVTGGAETGSAGTLDTNFAYSARVYAYPVGEWGKGQLADLDWHPCLATRVGAGFATSTIESSGSTEFNSVRVVDSGRRLSSLLPLSATDYSVNLYSIDGSLKYRGWSATFEHYFRTIYGFRGVNQGDLFDHGFWLQFGYFVIPSRLQLLSRWSRVQGNSGTLGLADQSSEEISGGFAWYFRDQNAKFVLDATYLDSAPIDSAALDISPDDQGWLYRAQIQFAF